jgi:hypothetical protein
MTNYSETYFLTTVVADLEKTKNPFIISSKMKDVLDINISERMVQGILNSSSKKSSKLNHSLSMSDIF